MLVDLILVVEALLFGVLSGSVGVAFIVVLADITKGAQIPFLCWLPAAMAASTPVSALVHSTLVTAGVYLLIHFSPFKYWLNVILLLIPGLTMFMAGLGVNFEYDSRRIIALPSLRQLGLMIMTIFLGLFSLAFFHSLYINFWWWCSYVIDLSTYFVCCIFRLLAWLWDGWFYFSDNWLSVCWYGAPSFIRSIQWMLFLSTYGVSFGPLEVGHRETRIFDSGWIEYFGGQGLYWVLFNLSRVHQWFQHNSLGVVLECFVTLLFCCLWAFCVFTP